VFLMNNIQSLNQRGDLKVKHKLITRLFTFLFFISCFVLSQEKHYYQTDFSKETFKTRRAKVFKKIGDKAIALIQGASGVDGFDVFRQSNSFYYLCGLETPHAYLLLDGRNKKTTLYLPHRDAGRERSEGKILLTEDADRIIKLTGVDQARGVESLSVNLVGGLSIVQLTMKQYLK
jgi:Xaa-Pro aminopeptidase